MEKDARYKEAQRSVVISIAANISLSIIKAIIGYFGNSRALLADAMNSASDVGGSIAIFLGLRAAKQAPDEDHPYGHGKAEPVAAMIVAVLMAIVGLETASSSIQAFREELAPPEAVALIAVAVAIVVKELLFRYQYSLGKRIRSDAVMANAHEHRADVFASSAALVGISAALAGGYFGIDWLLYADPAAGLVVALLILRMAWKVGSEAAHSTLDHVMHEEEAAPMREKASRVAGVKRIDSFYAREHGYYVIIDVKVSVDPHITVEAGHRIGKRVKEVLMEEEHVQNVFVHINPYLPAG
ncbi:cation diffusion facilitator family transporter [Ectobacillus ponti]|uniref:Cation diffusion facilitator family transporter n=1 Tax=Ectobacillus ponti TaxID=2961894 RepID=A0AA42BN47_9BACI|nr:cation diffusion facilitator family transporter [Ectobacillus ponti]MCP8967287.1 cation diffusion facilitator family transporter [Ectobacillus ponti]